MKNITLLILFVSLIGQQFTAAQQFKKANEYLDFVSEEQEKISKNMWKYTKAVAHSKSDRTVRGKRNVLIKSVERAIAKIKRANGFDGDDYKNKVLKLLNFNLNLLKEDYAKIIDMKAVAEQSYDLMEAYMLAQELADEKMEEAQQQYETDFYAFANKHNIQIIESESDLSKKMQLSNEVFKHYKELYLIYFKVFINEVYLMDALGKSDISAIQQSANALSEASNEGLQTLKTTAAYNNDDSVIKATANAFEFFKDEAENKVPIMTEFLVQSKDLETIKAKLDKIPQRKRTKKQIDGFNKKVKAINKQVKVYNKTTNELNTKRQQVINDLNLANENFLARHIPNE